MAIRLSSELFLLSLCTMVVFAHAKEYILEDLIAMETAGSNARRNVQQAAKTNDKRTDSRLLKNTRAIGDKRNTTTADSGDTNTNGKDEDDEDKKTLAQQVADGKYGLIQKELFVEPPKRPGIISYEVNPEVPKDNINNLGGLKPEEIWLAENHLLVLAGGGRYDDDRLRSPPWPPIDNYKAPPRQVKIPPEPKVPPPFPVQLRPGGPTEFIRGANGSGGPPAFPFFPPPGNYTGGIQNPFFGPPINLFQGNFTPGNGPIPPFPFPPFPGNGSAAFPPPPPFGPGPFPPPGANFLPPPVNLTGQLDEDDPSIYYPPPYDFVYKRDNTTAVPPGPLVPGIVLPPPPDFFAPLEEERQKTKQQKRPSVTVQKPKRPRPSVSILTTIEPERPRYGYTTTRRPAVKIVTDDPSQQVDLNEVTPTTVQHALPPNAVVQGWVPIPAPRPFYITGIRKPSPVKSTRLNQEHRFVDGYTYEKPHDIYNTPNDEPKKWIDYRNVSRPVFIDESIYYRPTTTVAPVPYVTKAKAIKTFYYYDEPQRPLSTPATSVSQSYYTTVRPSPQYYDTTQRPVAPLKYYYITEPPPATRTTTVRPPVFEYSYTAPGYGTIEAPRLSGVTTTQPPPLAENVAQYDGYYDDYEVRPPATGAPVVTTPPPPLRSTTVRPPKTDVSTTRSPYILQTENPYHAYFTHHDYSLIDDITKKYFTIFGQKINGDTPTTPLAGTAEEVTRGPATRVKFPTESPIGHGPLHATYPPPSYWSTPAPSPNVQQGLRYPQQYSEYDYYDDGRGTDYGYHTVRDYYDSGTRQHQVGSAALLQQPQLSYEGDTRVNTIRPYPAKDPNAESFTQHKNNGYLRPLKTQTAQSLQQDTRVNYVQPLQPVNPDAEYYNNRKQPSHNVPYQANSFDPETRQKLILSIYNQLLGRVQGATQTHRPPSLQHDIKVNDRFVGQNVTPDPDVEVFDPQTLGQRVHPLRAQDEVHRPIVFNPYTDLVGTGQSIVQQSHRPPSLQHDTKVNDLYKSQNVTPDPESESFDPRTLGNPSNANTNGRYVEHNTTPKPGGAELFNPLKQVQQFTGDGRVPSGVIAYNLPGNGGGHFYFLTPQTAGHEDQPDRDNNLYRRRNVRRQSSQQNNRRQNYTNSKSDKKPPNNDSNNVTNNNERTIQR